LERVRLIRRALSVGFSLPELTAILKMRDQGGVPCQRVRAIAESKLTQVKEQIKGLVVMRKQLEQTLEKWDARLARVQPGVQARLLETLPDDSRLLHGLGLRTNKIRLNKNKKGGRI
jgi:DNA-binding transcriptional MerR regulator